MDCGVSCPGSLERKIFYLLENYLKILICSQVSDRCPPGYLFLSLTCSVEAEASSFQSFGTPRGNLCYLKGHQTFPLCLTYKQRTVLCVLPLILSMRSLKRSIEGKPVQFHGSIQIPQINIHRKASAVRGNIPYSIRIPF